MKPTDAEIRRYATGLAESYGAHSIAYAEDMIRAYLANGHTLQFEVWKKVRDSLAAKRVTRRRSADEMPAAAE